MKGIKAVGLLQRGDGCCESPQLTGLSHPGGPVERQSDSPECDWMSGRIGCVKLGGTADLTSKFVPADKLPGFFYDQPTGLTNQGRKTG